MMRILTNRCLTNRCFCVRTWRVLALVAMLWITYATGGVQGMLPHHQGSPRLIRAQSRLLFWQELWLLSGIGTRKRRTLYGIVCIPVIMFAEFVLYVPGLHAIPY